MAVDAKFYVKCGGRGSGKTRETLDELYEAVKKRNRKALIFDVKDEFSNYLYKKATSTEPEERHNIKAIDLYNVPRFAVQQQAELVRLAPFAPDNRPLSPDELLTNLEYVLNNYRNGILLTEDLSLLVADNVPKSLYGALSTLRQAGVDVVAHFQMVAKAANPKIMGHYNYLCLHKTKDSVRAYPERFGEQFDIVLVAENIVNARYRWGKNNNIQSNKGIYFGVTIDVDDNKIRGIFNKQEALAACKNAVDYLKYAKNTFNMKDDEGRPRYSSYKDAFNFELDRMMDEFFIF